MYYNVLITITTNFQLAFTKHLMFGLCVYGGPLYIHVLYLHTHYPYTHTRAGESGLGKSTLVQSLFLTNFFGNKNNPPAIGEFHGDYQVVVMLIAPCG